MLDALPRSPRQLRALAKVHGGYGRLTRWGLLFYGTRPLLALARVRALATGTRLIFVTGTQGKTTATRALRHLLGLTLDSWSDSNVNVRGEVGWTVLREPPRSSSGRHGGRRKQPSGHVTAEATPYLPLEVGDGVGMLGVFTRALQPEVALVLNTGDEHLSLHGSATAVVAELAEVTSRLPANGVAVLNADDPGVNALADTTSARVVWFGKRPDSVVRITDAARDGQGRLVVTLQVADEQFVVRTRLIGLHYATVVAGVIATAVTLGIPTAAACERLATLPVTPSRLEPFRSSKRALILSDDFKATPETTLAGLREVAELSAARRWLVLGDLTNLPDTRLGDHYRDIAVAAARVGDEVVTYGPEWRDQRAAWDGMEASVTQFDDLAAAAAFVANGHGPHDLIYVKGSEDTRIRRITLSLAGYEVGCRLVECKKAYVLCENCADLGGRP